MTFNFYRDGGDSTLEVPTLGPYLPCTMRQIATNTMVEYSPPCELNSLVERSGRFLQDTDPRVIEASIGTEINEAFNRIEGKAFMTGREYNEPKGVFLSERIQRLSSALSNSSVINLYYTLAVRHRQSAAFLCNPDILHAVRQLKNTDGRFLFTQGLCAGDPDRLMGVPLHTDRDAPPNQLALGDFRKGYLIKSSLMTKIIRDPFSRKPHVLFFAMRKVGGAVQDDEAIKILEWSNV